MNRSTVTAIAFVVALAFIGGHARASTINAVSAADRDGTLARLVTELSSSAPADFQVEATLQAETDRVAPYHFYFAYKNVSASSKSCELSWTALSYIGPVGDTNPQISTSKVVADLSDLRRIQIKNVEDSIEAPKGTQLRVSPRAFMVIHIISKDASDYEFFVSANNATKIAEAFSSAVSACGGPTGVYAR
jgi:hypothetical protein